MCIVLANQAISYDIELFVTFVAKVEEASDLLPPRFYKEVSDTV
ncbi:hypothetical protein PORCRE_1208 [Porphyromonas crevioricanis JCM 15906]|uniref:Uncharacterized protein n=1 Tax=Porphyromonas crevioricanis JCM 15906 TaxID=1305617 RepID=T1DS02_9PORP|nr:hypothetical protein PORCRE_1208 [Porphyromonas crevioricanis JCM 15906]GAD07731.1 hypothetical protein PORCAN_1356 [Porphyromonas crevioricanis JCM 13913]